MKKHWSSMFCHVQNILICFMLTRDNWVVNMSVNKQREGWMMKARLKGMVTKEMFDAATFGGHSRNSRYKEFLHGNIYHVNIYHSDSHYANESKHGYKINDYSYSLEDFNKIFEIVEE